jgi:hypothetical protein
MHTEEDERRRQQLLGRIADHSTRLRRYIWRKNRVSVICIVSSGLAALITAGPATGGGSFIELVKAVLGLSDGDLAGRLVCMTAMIVSVVAAIAANISKPSELSVRVQTAEAGVAELDKLAVELEFGGMSATDGSVQYSEVIKKTSFLISDDSGRASPQAQAA